MKFKYVLDLHEHVIFFGIRVSHQAMDVYFRLRASRTVSFECVENTPMRSEKPIENIEKDRIFVRFV